MRYSKTYIVLLLFLVLKSYAQELPLVNRFIPDSDYAESQNWAISQDKNGFIYIANNSGLLEFNGAGWKLYPTPNETIMRSVKVFEDKIFTGFYMDFGFWKKNEYGLLEYTSIVAEQGINLLDDEQIWNIIELDGWVLFQSLQRIYIYNLQTGAVKQINSKENASISKMFEVDGNIYFQETGSGVFKIENGEAELISDYQVFKDSIIVLGFKKDSELIFLTDSDGFYTLNRPYYLKNKGFRDSLFEKTIYTAKKLRNGDFIIGTISNGVIYSTKDGIVKFELNQHKGLSNNTVLSVFEDDSGNVWLGLDNGINKIDVKSSIKIYKDIKGALGTVYASSFYKGYLYLGTNQGLFCKPYPSTSNFEFIKGTEGQVWHLTKINDELFCGHNSGTFIVNKGEASKISQIQGCWDVKKIDNKTILLGSYDGLYVFENTNKQWVFRNKIEGFNRSTRFFEMFNKNTVFINHEYKGVYKLRLNDDLTKVVDFKLDSTLEKGIHSSLLKYQGDVIYAYRGGVYKFKGEKDTFIKDTLLSKLIKKEGFLSGKIICDNYSKKLFSFSQQSINYLRPDKFSSNAVVEEIGISNTLRKGAVGYENIKHLSGSKYLLGILNGYIIVDLKLEEAKKYQVKINAIKNHKLNSESKYLKLNESVILPPKHNTIEFSYSVPYLSKDKQINYRYILKGYMDEWSEWSHKHDVLFENLSYGEYDFKVEAKIGDKPVKEHAKYSFSISKPWYFSNVAIVSYLLIFIVFSVVLDRLYKSYYRRQREVLLKKQEQEFKLKTLASEKELIEIKNEQLNKDVKSKNRELAASTMSMIKKNELLSLIKKEILNRTDEDSMKNVIKIIDANINNDDDRKMFEEAFNNVDKDFIKKIKKLHNNLTPNDLRLCAYLRFNLSSKEIAPLLNISSRSVEVKRYRLRKKMNLPHDVNLTNYILEI